MVTMNNNGLLGLVFATFFAVATTMSVVHYVGRNLATWKDIDKDIPFYCYTILMELDPI